MMEHPVVEKALKNNESALQFVRTVAGVLHAWDDLIDRDKPVSDADVNGAFLGALVTLPRNAFYRDHFEALNTILVSSIINWRVATQIEREHACEGEDLKIAYIIRSTYVDLLVMSAAIIGGVEWAVSHGYEIREWAHQEKFAGYLQNLAAERAARKD